jgi:predicted unusual protein kinase regulating ubiquinone biosynthesis (AarF/ABC1/UbiB family)
VNLAPTHLKRYKDVAWLFLKYGNADLDTQTGFAESSAKKGERAKDATGLADDLENLGPTFVKIGQLLSTRSDLLPPVYLDALSRLQDKVEPVPYEAIQNVVQDQLGVRISKAFESFDQAPIGSASLGQVHRAVLRGGREVAVKVQRPDIRTEIVDDLDSLESIAEFLDAHTDFGRKYETGRILAEFRSTLMRELDYQKEARHLSQLRENLKEFPRMHVPAVVEDYSTSMVLTMDYLSGTKVTSLSGAVLVDIDGSSLAEELFRAYLKQILVDGLFHADPHPGNLLVTPDHHLAILDLGMVGRMNQRMQDQMMHLLAGISHGDGQQVAEAALRLGEARNPDFERSVFFNAIETIVGELKDARLEEIQIGQVVLMVMQTCAASGIRIPAEISLLGKTLMNLDRVGVLLSPNFDANESIRRNLESIAQSRIKDSFSIAGIMGALTETKELLGTLPRRTNEILELVSTNKLRVKVDSIDEHKLMLGLQKVANRITAGLILSAFIVGSSMLARVETSFRIFGYPGLAMVFFLIAAICSIILMIQIFFKDE